MDLLLLWLVAALLGWRGLELNADACFFTHLDQVLDLFAILLRNLVHTLVLVGVLAIMHLDRADFRLAVRDGSGQGDDERAFLVARGEAVIRADHGGHDLARCAAELEAGHAGPLLSAGEPADTPARCATEAPAAESAARGEAPAAAEARALPAAKLLLDILRLRQREALDRVPFALAKNNHIYRRVCFHLGHNLDKLAALVRHRLAVQLQQDVIGLESSLSRG